MDFELTWHLQDEFANVRLAGAPTLGHVLSAIELIAVESTSWSHGLLLVDLRNVTSLRSFTEQFAIGEAAARALAKLHRVASSSRRIV